MATLPNNITALPVPPSASDTATFDARADAFLLALPIMADQLNSANSITYANVLEAATNATNAATSATTALGYSDSASASASNATASAANLASFEKLYLGSKASDPTLDNSGNALLAGATYYSTTTLRIRAYSGSVWADGITAASGVSSINGNTGIINLKTINSNSIIGSGDLLIVGGLATTPIKTTNYTAVVNDMVRVDSTSAAFTVTLPASPADGDKVGLQDIANICGINPVLLAAAGGKTVEGDATGLSVNIDGAYVQLIYNATGTNWKLQATPSQASGAPLSLVANSTSPTLTVTQTGSGNAFVVEDSASADSTPFVIDANGRVVAGHTASIAVLGVDAGMQNWGSFGYTSQGRFTADTFGSVLSLVKSRNAAVGGQTVVQSGDEVGTLAFFGSDGTNFVRGAQITAAIDGTPGTNDMPGRLVFSTTADGASSPTERVRIGSTGASKFSFQGYFAATTLTDGATITWDTNANQVTQVTLAGNRTMAAPTNMVNGGSYSLAIIQDATGSRTLTWNSAFKFTSGTAPTLSTAANSKDYITFRSDGTNLYEQGRSQGVA